MAYARTSLRKEKRELREKMRALGNAVPLPMGRALAKAVKRALDAKECVA